MENTRTRTHRATDDWSCDAARNTATTQDAEAKPESSAAPQACSAGPAGAQALGAGAEA